MTHPTSGPLRVVGAPFHLSTDDTEPYRPPPRLGEHTGDVLKELLAVSDADLQVLQHAGAFGKSDIR
jgi:crotonobetainyl-CoA:carnitine CoA-transferase CaiB-like acyl-CoA transferase